MTLLIVVALAVVAVIVSWPLATQIGSSVPGGGGEPLFAAWAMAWVNDHISRAAFADFWNANIFFPERGTLAFSEPFIAQSVIVLPVYWASGNATLSYNVAFLLTFVLTGLGTFLLARALTGSVVAACVAAFIAAFNAHRVVQQAAHLHTLSIHWLPFAMYALHRYFQTDKRRHLILASTFLILVNCSAVSYIAGATVVFALFAVADVLILRRWRVLRVWLELWAAAAAVLVVTLPFVLPFIDVQRRFGFAPTVDRVPLLSLPFDNYLDARVISFAFLLLALLMAFAVAAIARVSQRHAIGVACVIVIAFVVMNAPLRTPMNALLASEAYAAPPDYLVLRTDVPPIYRAVEGLRPGAILVELPFGDAAYDLRYMWFSTAHRRRLLNGYSGLFPPSFRARQRVLTQPLLDPEASAQALSAATHVVVHRSAWRDDTGTRIGAWLDAFNATLLADVDGAALYELPAREGYALSNWRME